jgi:hypothetical protein
VEAIQTTRRDTASVLKTPDHETARGWSVLDRTQIGLNRHAHKYRFTQWCHVVVTRHVVCVCGHDNLVAVVRTSGHQTDQQDDREQKAAEGE